MTAEPFSARATIATTAAVMALAGASFWLSHLKLGSWATPVALGIASAKGLLIALIFMGLARQPASNRLVLITALLVMLLLVGFATADVLTR